MSKNRVDAITAARELAKDLAIPSTRASIFAWFKSGRDTIVISGDERWLKSHFKIPRTYKGYSVEIDRPISAQSHH